MCGRAKPMAPLESAVAVETSFRRVIVVVAFVFSGAARASPASADPPASAQATGSAGPLGAPTRGLAVVALAGATDEAWSLARSVYAAASLRPVGLDEAHAQVLCGERTPGGAPPELRDLADMVAALRGDDAPTRALLGDIAHRFSLVGVLIVRLDGTRPSARVFLADAASFDGAAYAPDDGLNSSWAAATRSLVRAFGARDPGNAQMPAAGSTSAPALATHGDPKVEGATARSRQFYESGWFWGALGAAAIGAGAVFLATRDTGPSAIHLQLEVPH